MTDRLTDEQLAKLDSLEAAATARASSHWAKTTTRTDGTAQVYAPNRGPLRVVVPVAETTDEDAELIVAMRNALPELLRSARLALKVREWLVEHSDITGVALAGTDAELPALRALAELRKEFGLE